MATERGLVGLGNAGESYENFGQGRHYEDCNPAGFDAHERVKVLDSEGIDISVMYPGLGLKLGGITDPAARGASCAVYNDWVAEWCSVAPDRLKGVGALPMQDPVEAAREAYRIRDRGLVAGFARPNAYNGRRLPRRVVHAGLGSARGNRSHARAAHHRPRRHARRGARHAPSDGDGNAPRDDPGDRPDGHAVEPRVRRCARAASRPQGRGARERRRLDRGLDGPAQRVRRELLVGRGADDARRRALLQAAVLDQLRSR